MINHIGYITGATDNKPYFVQQFKSFRLFSKDIGRDRRCTIC